MNVENSNYGYPPVALLISTFQLLICPQCNRGRPQCELDVNFAPPPYAAYQDCDLNLWHDLIVKNLVIADTCVLHQDSSSSALKPT